MPFATDDGFLTPAERLDELANLFATGILRLHTRLAPGVDRAETRPAKNYPKLRAAPLEVAGKIVLSVHTG